MKLIDTHVHFWDPILTPREVSPLLKILGSNSNLFDRVANWIFPKPVKTFFSSSRYLSRPYLVRDYIEDSDSLEIEGMVHVEAGWKGKGPLGPIGETRWLEDMNKHSGQKIRAIIVNAALDRGAKEVEVIIRSHLEASKLVKGARESLAWQPDKRVLNGCKNPNKMADLEWNKGLEVLSRHNLSFEATIYHNQLIDLSAVAKAHSELDIMLSHLGTPVDVGGCFTGADKAGQETVFGKWKDGMAQLAENQNVYVKLSGLSMPVVGFGWSSETNTPSIEQVAETFSPFVEHAVDVFGPDRCVFGSNYPIDKVSLPLSTLVQAFDLILSNRDEAVRQRIFYQNAADFYRIVPRNEVEL